MTESPSVPPGTGPLSPEFAGIDPVLMDGFITELERAGQVIAEQVESIRRELASVDLPAAGLAPIREIGGWVEQQVPRLRQRLAAITAPVPDIPAPAPAVATPATALAAAVSAVTAAVGPGLRPYREDALLPPAEAQRLGEALGERFAAIDPEEFRFTGPYASARLAAVFQELEAYQGDPVFTAAFFAAIGPGGMRQIVPALRRLHGQEPQDAERVAALAFATAVSGGAHVPGFAAAVKAVEEVEAGDDEGMRMLSALFGHGDYPDVWLAERVAPLLVGGVPSAALLNALANNPAAARLAITPAVRFSPRPALPPLKAPPLGGLPMTGDVRPGLAAFLKGLNERTRGFPEQSKAFGRLLAAATGVYDEQDGKHSREAAVFAYAVMTGADEWRLNDATRVHLAEIAASYATEITLGANLNDADLAKDSAMQVAPGWFEWTPLPQVRGSFRLSPEDTFRFMTAFAGNAEARFRFGVGMDEFLQRTLSQPLNTVKNSGNTIPLTSLFLALGNVRGTELAAAVRVLQPEDERAESAENAESFVAGATLAVLGLVSPFTAIPVTWTALSTGVSAYYTYGREPEEKVKELRESADTVALGRRHEMALLLMKQGFAPQTPPAGIIADSNGNLRPFDEILQKGTEGMRAFDQWMVDNGLGKGNPLSLGELAAQTADRYIGGHDNAYSRGKIYGNTELMTD
ncbi:hypothetical protein GCM10009555_012180 [Acrocarpospora macrocephala]|uniref:Uncharacterized protein n=1 Tax=Acrocarpospora macrocephala TaxID=150177 RepID=A0A5M3WS63_9ACTN|nr:hypothetical protein [Acrocarpospora macrocephala]GES11336.1 hypothetical protein Amac_049330 [Acrocarpospora macrocephala]